jgi:tetratricopeptide (TPR) repeat protein
MLMKTPSVGERINDLIEKDQYDEARRLIEKELEKEPDSHWLLTQLGSTYYEQRQYKKALKWLLKSLDILDDCPLTLWHLAGTLEALEKPKAALRIYSWLLESRISPEEDPCWESVEWTENLKTDCVYRIGTCFVDLKQKAKAAQSFRRYVDLLLAGAPGMYSLEEVQQHLDRLRSGKREAVEAELRKTADWVHQSAGHPPLSNGPPKIDRKTLRQLQGK